MRLLAVAALVGPGALGAPAADTRATTKPTSLLEPHHSHHAHRMLLSEGRGEHRDMILQHQHTETLPNYHMLQQWADGSIHSMELW